MLFFLSSIFLAFARIQSHLIVGDPESAVEEARLFQEREPEVPKAHEWLIKSLAAAGEESKMMAAWEVFHDRFPKDAVDHLLLEEMCWGILNKGRKATGANTRLISLIGAALTQDVRALEVVREGMRCSNSLIRSVAIQIGALYGDYPLKEEIIRLFREERVWEVRQQLIRAVGKLQITSFIPQLMEIISSSRSGIEEKKEATKALAVMRDHVGSEELKELIQSKRAGLRMLACECVVACQLKEEAPLLSPLIKDSHPEVRSKAIEALALLRMELPLTTYMGRDPFVGIATGWALLLSRKEEGKSTLKRFLQHERSEVRSLAASAVAAAGPYGISLAREILDESEDPYVQANVAFGLIGQREDVVRSAEILATFLRTHPEPLMRKEGLFSPLQKSTHLHNPAIPNFPEVVNQTTRLEILNLLAIIDYPEAEEAIKDFLRERRWGVTGLAAETLLGEGDESAFDLIRQLLEDPDKEIRSEAALVLATWGKDNSAIPTLLQTYEEADRQLKIKILEALGRVGDAQAIPFLIERLKEPSQTLRIIAATVLIQTLNH